MLKILNMDIYRKIAGLIKHEQIKPLRPTELSPVVIPVIELQTVLAEGMPIAYTLDLRGTLGTFVPAHTVPIGYRDIVLLFRRSTSTGNSQIRVYRPRNGNFADISEPNALGATIGPRGYFLEEGDQVGMLASGNVADSSIQLNLLFHRIKIRT